jgi:hypothetical protein
MGSAERAATSPNGKVSGCFRAFELDLDRATMAGPLKNMHRHLRWTPHYALEIPDGEMLCSPVDPGGAFRLAQTR